MIKTITTCLLIATQLTHGLLLRGETPPHRRLEVAAYMNAMAPPPAFCYVENGFDYLGEDLTNVPGTTAESCCNKCAGAQGCKAYSWTNFNGGTCWLKKSRGKIVVNPNVKSALFFYGTRDVCTIKNDIDYVGNDIGNAVSTNAEACCDKCRAFAGCRAFSWSNHNGGTCWFKSARGQAVTKTGVRSADAFPIPDTPVCALEENVDYVGFDIGSAPSASASACCGICSENLQCRAYSWTNQNGGTCWLKSYKGETISKQGVISAQVKPNPTCDFEVNVDYIGNDVANAPSKDASLCCPLCRDRSDCKAVTWSDHNGGTCWFKSGKGATATKNGVKSAVVNA